MLCVCVCEGHCLCTLCQRSVNVCIGVVILTCYSDMVCGGESASVGCVKRSVIDVMVCIGVMILVWYSERMCEGDSACIGCVERSTMIYWWVLLLWCWHDALRVCGSDSVCASCVKEVLVCTGVVMFV